jgi:hypothetical protein
MNTARAGSPVWNDPKQALRTKINPQVAVLGLNKIISMRATTTILNSTNSNNTATSIPNKLNNNSYDNDNINDNSNINGVDKVMQNEEKKN